MAATFLRSTLMLVASLAVVAWGTVTTEAKHSKAGLGVLLPVIVAMLVTNVATVVMAGTCSRPLLTFLPHNEWMALPGEIVIRASSAVFGLWAASILLQCAQNVGRRLSGLSAEPIEWIRLPKKPRHKKKRAEAGTR